MAKVAPLSVKMGAERLERVDAYAVKANLTRHGAVLDLIDQGLQAAEGGETPVKKKAAPEPEAKKTPFVPRPDTYPSWMRPKPKGEK